MSDITATPIRNVRSDCIRIAPGTIFGRLTVVHQAGARVSCACECGSGTRFYDSYRLRHGEVKSCGCYLREFGSRVGRSRLVHGMHQAPEYRAWVHMKARCNDPNGENFPLYGGRGIQVCAEWMASFEAFYAHIGPRPSRKHTVDRIDVNGNYEVGNVRWADKTEQTRNRRNTVHIEFGGIKKPLKAWCDQFGLDYYATHRRIRRYGWSPERAFAAKEATDA